MVSVCPGFLRKKVALTQGSRQDEDIGILRIRRSNIFDSEISKILTPHSIMILTPHLHHFHHRAIPIISQVITGKRKMDEAEGTVWSKRRYSWSSQALDVLKVRCWLASSVQHQIIFIDRDLQHTSLQARLT